MNEELVMNPTRLDISRSVFPVRRRDMGTGFVGRLNVCRPFEVLPGSTFDLNLANLVRFTTPIVPTMDDLYMDVYFYYTSDEMLLKRQSFSPSLNDGNHSFAAIMGAQDGLINMPFPDADLSLPKIKYLAYQQDVSDSSSEAHARVHCLANSLLDQLGYPVIQRDTDTGASLDDSLFLVDKFNCLPLLGYISIWNEDFREPNLQNRFVLTIDANNTALFDSDTKFMGLTQDVGSIYGASYGSSGKPIIYDSQSHWTNGGPDVIDVAVPFGVSRFHGLFGSLLPWPQRNSDPVYLPLGELAPVITGDEHLKSGDKVKNFQFLAGTISDPATDTEFTIGGAPATGGNLRFGGAGQLGLGGSGSAVGTWAAPSNLWADLRSATSASINTIRAAFQTQKWFEALARGGNSDLDEYINSLFGVVGNIDVETKRPVYLGGKRIPISISQVNNTGADTGETGAFSLTNDNSHYFKWHSKSYGMIFCVFCIRHADMFADAPQKFLLRRSKFDFYFPQFANLGEEGYSPSLMAFDAIDYTGDPSETPIGYQEYAADYRYDFNALSGQFRFTGDNSWHYATLLMAGKFDLKSWLDASYQAIDVDRTLKTSGSQAFMQFYYDFLIYGKKYLPMPVNSIPGLVDHH